MRTCSDPREKVRGMPTFWLLGGPQRDALGRAASGEVVLVKAKAHLNELYSPASGASESSLMQIQSRRSARRRSAWAWSLATTGRSRSTSTATGARVPARSAEWDSDAPGV